MAGVDIHPSEIELHCHINYTLCFRLALKPNWLYFNAVIMSHILPQQLVPGL